MASSSDNDNISKKVLILGAGMCSRPLVDYLSNKCGFSVTVGSRTLQRAQNLIKNCKNCVAIEIDVQNDEGKKLLEKIVVDFNCVISMLPYLLHHVACKAAVSAGKHFLTTSYIQPGVRECGEEAKKKGLVIINECGVDPGTDHMSAMRFINQAEKEQGKIIGFTSFCGGLPAPDSNTNPFGYKFAWAPRGVLLASTNPAKFLRDGKDVDVKKGTLFLKENYDLLEVDAPGMDGIKFEAYPNRDSTPYKAIYGLKDVELLKRGTYRYFGWCDTVQKFQEIGFLSTEPQTFSGKDLSLAKLTASLINISDTEIIENKEKLREAMKQHLNIDDEHKFILERFEWLGLFDNNETISLLQKSLTTSTLDILCDVMQNKMQYEQNERDMLLMQHVFNVEYPDRTETVTSTMVDYGIKNGDSSMSRTVSFPIGIATKLVLTGKYTTPGLSIPIVPELYNPILDELEKDYQIKWEEKVVSSKKKNNL